MSKDNESYKEDRHSHQTDETQHHEKSVKPPTDHLEQANIAEQISREDITR